MGRLREPSVIHVITGLELGGAETMLTALATAEAAAGMAPVVVSLTVGGTLRETLVNAGVDVIELGMRRGRGNPGGVVRLARIIRRYKPSAVLGWMYHANIAVTLALVLSGTYRKTPHYWGIRCSDMDISAYGWVFRCVVRASARLSGMPDAVVYNSDAGITSHRALGFNPRRSLLIDNGIDILRFRPNPQARVRMRNALGIDREMTVVAVTARVDPMKDYPMLLAALDRVPGVTTVVMGEGTDKELPRRAGLLALGRRNDVPQILAAADVIVSSSAFGEGFSNALAEGMACGLPAVATDVGDAKRIIGDTGIVVPARDPQALAAALGSLIHAGNLVDRGLAARKRIVENFSLERSVERFHQLYTDGLSGEDRSA